MRARVVLVGVVLTLATARHAFAVDDIAAQERLGARVGYVETFDGLHAYFGPGWDLTLYFEERLFSRLFLDVHVGATYLGDLLAADLDDRLLRPFGYTNVESEMRVFYFSAGVVYGIPLGSSAYTLTLAAAAGIYSVSVAFVADQVADDFSDQYFGGNGGIGFSWRVGTSYSLEANGSVHYFDTGQGVDDLLWWYTEGTAEDPLLLDVSVGIAFDLR